MSRKNDEMSRKDHEIMQIEEESEDNDDQGSDGSDGSDVGSEPDYDPADDSKWKMLSHTFVLVEVIIAGLLIGFGAYLINNVYGTFNTVDTTFILFEIGLVLLLIGFVILALAVFQCNMVHENYVFGLGLYVIVAFLMAIVFVIGGFYIMTNMDKWARGTDIRFRDIFQQAIAQASTSTYIMKFLDWFQIKNKCCGFFTYQDWTLNANFPCNATKKWCVPTSCCTGDYTVPDHCTEAKFPDKFQACRGVIKSFLVTSRWYLAGAGGGFGLILIFHGVVTYVIWFIIRKNIEKEEARNRRFNV